MQDLITVGKFVLIGGVLYISYIIGKKHFEKSDTLISTQNSTIGQQEIKAVKIEPKFGSEFAKIASRFEGLYERLFEVIQNKREHTELELSSLISQWELNIKLYGAIDVQNIWNDLVQEHFHSTHFSDSPKKDLTSLKGFLIQWYYLLVDINIKRDDREAIKITDFAIHHYYILDNVYNIGDEIKIDKPCWMLNEICVDKGIATVQKNL